MKEIKLTKPRAKTEIIFKEDKDDSWFIWVHHVEKKSGKKSSSLIIQKDMDHFMKCYLDKGWIVFDPNAPVEVKVVKPRKIKAKMVKMKRLINNPSV